MKHSTLNIRFSKVGNSPYYQGTRLLAQSPPANTQTNPQSTLHKPILENSHKISLRVVTILTAVFVFALTPVLRAQSAALEYIEPEAIPLSGTFWSLQLGGNYPPMSYLPGYLGDVKVYYSGEGNSYMYNDLDFDYESYFAKQAEIVAEADGLKSLDGEGGPNCPLDYGTNDLWLEITAVTNHFAFLTLHNTVTNQPYALLTKADLTWSNWTPELRVTGVAGNETPAQLATRERTNLFVWVRTCTSSNLAVDSSPTAEQLAQLLVGRCTTISSVIYTGAAVARGTFTNGICSGLPIENGVILATGDITNAIGPNNTNIATTPFGTNGDGDLDHLVGGSGTADAAVLEFDIVASNSFVLEFQYVFASEEYPEWIGQYNDPMAIFVSTNYDGTNWIITPTNNIALVPGTTDLPVSVNNVNGGCISDYLSNYISPTNPQYYVDNHDPDYSAVPPYAAAAPVANIQYDGMTTNLTAQIHITAGVTNHIKIAIADFGDSVVDSAVFIKAAPQCS